MPISSNINSSPASLCTVQDVLSCSVAFAMSLEYPWTPHQSLMCWIHYPSFYMYVLSLAWTHSHCWWSSGNVEGPLTCVKHVPTHNIKRQVFVSQFPSPNIHYQVRHDQLMRQQEKMIQDMEKAVYRREAILLKWVAYVQVTVYMHRYIICAWKITLFPGPGWAGNKAALNNT